MDKKIIFFDIDGTLIDEKTDTIPESTKEALKKAKENGHFIFINTGRPISEINTRIKELQFDGYVCGCGTYIELHNKELMFKSLGTSLSKKIVSKLRKCNIDGILEGKKDIYYNENSLSEEVVRIKKFHMKEGFYSGTTWDDPYIDFDKLVIWITENSDFDSFHEEFKDVFDFIKRDIDFYELAPIGFSKASGIKFLMDYLDIPLENTYAIGDSTNDLSMLEYVENSIAMGNSNPILFDLVSFVTKNVDDDGIYRALKHYEII